MPRIQASQLAMDQIIEAVRTSVELTSPESNLIRHEINKLAPTKGDILLIKVDVDGRTPQAWEEYCRKVADAFRQTLNRAGKKDLPLIVMRNDVDVENLHFPTVEETYQQHALEAMTVRHETLRTIARWGSLTLIATSLLAYLSL